MTTQRCSPRGVGRAGASAAATAALAVLSGTLLGPPQEHLAALQTGLSGGAPVAATPLVGVVAVAALAAQACAAYLAVVAALLLAGGLPGRAGRAVDRLARVVAPAAVRRAVAVLLGLAVVTGPTPVAAVSDGPAGRPAAVTYDWPSVDGPTGPASAGPTGAGSHGGVVTSAAPSATATAEGPGSSAQHDEVVVETGDCLWHLAARDLGPAATDAQVASAWPSWWAANRDVIGDDPDLLRPGQVLHPPP